MTNPISKLVSTISKKKKNKNKSLPQNSHSQTTSRGLEDLGMENGSGFESAGSFDLEAETAKAMDLLRKVEALEREKSELVKNNEEVMKLEEGDLGFKIDEEAGEDVKALEVIAAMSEGGEGNADVRKVDIDTKVGELESNFEGTEERKETDLFIKESEIISLNKKVVELEAAINREKAEKKALEDALKIANVKVGELETKLIISRKKLEEAEIAIDALKQTVVQAVNGMVDRDANERTINLQRALGAGAMVAFVGGIVCFLYARTR